MTRSVWIDHNTTPNLAVHDAHMTWIGAEADSEHALRAWFEAGAPDRAAAYLTYRAAVDREEAAARELQRLRALTRPHPERSC
jgi:hypothetical protein